LFDLSTWGSGLCHTYNPPGEVEPGVTGQLYALLGDEKLTLTLVFIYNYREFFTSEFDIGYIVYNIHGLEIANI